MSYYSSHIALNAFTLMVKLYQKYHKRGYLTKAERDQLDECSAYVGEYLRQEVSMSPITLPRSA